MQMQKMFFPDERGPQLQCSRFGIFSLDAYKDLFLPFLLARQLDQHSCRTPGKNCLQGGPFVCIPVEFVGNYFVVVCMHAVTRIPRCVLTVYVS